MTSEHSSPGDGAGPQGGQVSSRFDVVCGTRAGRDLHVDIYQPTGDVNRRTAVLVHHGGGWRADDRKMLQPRCEALVRQGFTAIAVEYRLLDHAPWPTQMQDVNGAVRWTRAHADELGVDLDKIVLQGHSAGAHLALMAAGTPGHPDFDLDFATQGPVGPIAAVIAYYPPVHLVAGRALPDLRSGAPPGPEMLKALRGDDGTGPAALLLGPTATEAEAAAVSPINYAKAGFPPTLIFHGTDDMVVAPIAALNLHHKLLDAGVPSEVHIIAGANHEFDATPSLGDVCLSAVTSFLSRYIIDPQGFAEEVLRTNPMAAMAAMRQG